MAEFHQYVRAWKEYPKRADKTKRIKRIRETKAVELNYDDIKEAVRDLLEQLKKQIEEEYENRYPDQPVKDALHANVVAQVYNRPLNKNLGFGIWLDSRSPQREGFRPFVIGGEASMGRGLIRIFVNGGRTWKTWRLMLEQSPFLISEDLESFLVHEFNHMADQLRTKNQNNSNLGTFMGHFKYRNRPEEVRSFAQEMLYYIIKQREWEDERRVQDLLKRNKQWKEVRPFLSDKNIKRILRTILEGLKEAGYEWG